MAIPVQSQIYNPITGVFGTGQMQIFGVGQSGVWYVPPGIGKCRVRIWGGGGSAGGGGGFTLKTIYDLSGVTSVPVTVGGAGGTSSFGFYCSATGGTTAPSGGLGVGGDINTSGGATSGGGAGNLFGNGGGTIPGASGSYSMPSGLFSGGTYNASTSFYMPPNSGIGSQFSIDLIGTGPGSNASSTVNMQGVNGGGGYSGSFPGGGSQNATSGVGGSGLVIVEY